MHLLTTIRGRLNIRGMTDEVSGNHLNYFLVTVYQLPNETMNNNEGAPGGNQRNAWSAPWYRVFFHSPVFRRSDRLVHGDRASCSPRPFYGPVIWNVFITRPSSCRYDATDPFHAATDLPEHLFGPGICPVLRMKIVKPFGSPCWSYPCTYPQLFPSEA
jgi:hypothetical protein